MTKRKTGKNKIVKGNPNFIQVTKSIFKAAAAIRFGGLPTKVANPPIFAAYAVPRITKTLVRGYFLSTRDIPIGRSMAVVAVLLIHMERKEELARKKIIPTHLLPPDKWIILVASHLSIPCSLKTEARANPPRNR
jgi:hypothetical protein